MTSRAARYRQQSKARLVNVEPLTRLTAIINGAGIDEVPLGEYLTREWLPAVSLEVEASTFTNLQRHVNAYIIPNLGDVSVCDINRDVLRRFYQVILHTPKSRGNGLISKNTCISIHATRRCAGRCNASPTADASSPIPLGGRGRDSRSRRCSSRRCGRRRISPASWNLFAAMSSKRCGTSSHSPGCVGAKHWR